MSIWRSAAKAGYFRYSASFFGVIEKSSSPYINRFLQPDTIVPSVENPQSWNRYSYTLNSPLIYTDSTGHFADPVTLALAGAALGFFGNVAFQMGSSLWSGESQNLSEAFQSVDWKTAVTYGVAGAVAGATYGAINPAATIAGAALAGGVSGVVSGQAAALFDATWEFGEKIIKKEKPKTSYGMDFVEDAHEAGFLDWERMLFDFGTGAVLAGTLQGVSNALSIPQATYVTKSARNKNALLPGQYGAVARGTSKWAEEWAQQWLDKKNEDIEKRLSKRIQ